MKSFRYLPVLGVLAVSLLLSLPAAAQRPLVVETAVADGASAESLFARAEAAIYFPDEGLVRWVGAGPRDAATQGSSGEPLPGRFLEVLEREFPGFRENRYGPYLLKLPDRSVPLAAETLAGLAPDATILTEGFEAGMSQWQFANNTNGDYNFVAAGCQVHSGSWSVDAFRGGNRGQYLSCFESYPASLTTQMSHASCEAIQGAPEAWLDFYLTTQMDVSEGIGVYYLASDGYLYGYTFSGTWSGWYHIVLNLKQWNYIGDVTGLSCPKAIFQFRSDAAANSGTGPAIDDLAIRTSSPASLRCAITATPESGSAPLTVSFAPNVSGASGSETYEWRFGDASSTTSTSRTATFTYNAAGDYWVRLRVSENDTRAYAQTRVRVTAAGSCALSCVATVPAAAAAGAAVAFQSTATASGCGGSSSYLWSFGDGQTSSQQNVSHVYASAGTFSWTLTVANSGATCTKSGAVVVAAANRTAKRRSIGISPGPQPLAVSISGATATVTQAGTLAGASWTFPQAPPSGFAVSSVPASQAAAIPAGVTRLSDFFIASPGPAGGSLVTFSMPASLVPAGRSAKELRLYVYTDAASDASHGRGFGSSFWVRTWYDLNVQPSGAATIRLSGLGDVAFVGIEAPVTPPPEALLPWRPASLATSNCAPKSLPNGTTDANQQVCLITYEAGKSFTATIKNIGDLHLTPSASISDMVDWLAAARKAFDAYGMSSDATFEVDVGPMPADISTALGFVTTGNLEDRRVLHITSAPKAKASIQGTAVHEYFHHAQARTASAGLTNMINIGKSGLWLTEGLARWFEDDVFDSLDTYRLKEEQPLPRVLDAGLGARDDSDNDARTRGYARFGFWKMLQSSCSGFSLPQLMNIDRAADPNGMANAKSRIESGQWQCDFGSGLGEGNRGQFAAGLLKYAFATVKNDDISLLDSNERGFSFRGTAGLFRLTPSADCTPSTACAGASVSGVLPPAAVSQVIVEPVSSLPEGKVATLWLETNPAAAGLFLWAGDDERLTSSASEGKWGTAGTTGVQYGDTSRAPQAVVFVVNPSASAWVGVKIRAGFAAESKGEKFPWSFQTQWNDEFFKASAVWSATGSGILEAPKGTTVAVDTTLPNLPKLLIRGHGAAGPMVLSGSFQVTIKPMAGRYSFADGTYANFTFSNPRFTVDRLGTASGADFRYDIPVTETSAGLIQAWSFDLKVTCHQANGTAFSCGWEGMTGSSSGMIIDFERNQ